MLIWMTKQAKSLKAEVEGEIQSALANSENAEKVVFLLVFIAVLREGFETVLFVLAKFQDGWTVPTIGAIAGLLTATVLGFLLFAVGVKINLKLFFQVMGVFLLLIIGGLVMSVLKDVDLAVRLLGELDSRYQSLCILSGDSCLLGNQVWDGSQILPDQKFPGILLKALFGYRQAIYWLQIITYTLFLGIMGTVYFRSFQSSASTVSSSSTKLKKVS
jgi:high-affinity iron transporter